MESVGVRCIQFDVRNGLHLLASPQKPERMEGPWPPKSLRYNSHVHKQNWLVVSTPLKNMKVNWDDYSQYMGK